MASKSGAGSQSFGNFGLKDSEVRPFEHPKLNVGALGHVYVYDS